MASTGDDPPPPPKGWSDFIIPTNGASVAWVHHAEPTIQCKQLMNHFGDASTEPFIDPLELFQSSHELAPIILETATIRSSIVGWYQITIQTQQKTALACLDGGTEIPEATAKVVTHALRLVKTSPEIFGFCCKLQQATRKALFTFEPFPPREDFAMDPDVAQERHDICQWVASYVNLGKAFSMDGWESFYATSHLSPPMPEVTAATIQYGQEEIPVTQKGLDAMRESIRALENKPTTYFRQKHVIVAVTEILGKDLLEYSLPQTPEEINAFDWNVVVPGRSETYPIAKQPEPHEFAKVKAIHDMVAEERNKEAAKIGRPNGGTLSYCTYQQRWKQWRDIHATYRYMNPGYTLQMVADLVAANLKLCQSVHAQETKMAEDVHTHIGKLKAANRMKEKADKVKEQMAAIAEEEKKARDEVLELQNQQEKLAEERKALAETPATEMEIDGITTRSGRRSNSASSAALEQAKQRAVQAKAKEVAEVVKKRKQAEKDAQDKANEKARLQREQQEAEAAVPMDQKKRAKRNDIDRLDIGPSPRTRARLDGVLWNPPRKVPPHATYSKPGRLWKEENIHKLWLLSQLRSHLKGLLGQPMSLATLMSFIDPPDDNEVGFEHRVFIYLMALMLKETRSVVSCTFPKFVHQF